jgi:hypothetical protein
VAVHAGVLLAEHADASRPTKQLLPARVEMIGYLTAPEEVTQLYLLDTQIEMVRQATDLVRRKGRRMKAAMPLRRLRSGLPHHRKPAGTRLGPPLSLDRSEGGGLGKEETADRSKNGAYSTACVPRNGGQWTRNS